MAVNDGTKQARLTLETHKQLMELTSKLGGTVDETVRYLLGMSTVRVQVTDIERRRWTEAADEIGVTVDEFVRLRMESALQWGTDATTMYRIMNGVDALCRQAGLSYRTGVHKSTPGPTETFPS